MTFSAGDKVEVRRRNGSRSFWKPGKVIEVRGNRAVNVHLTHMSHPVTVKIKDVRVPRSARPLTQNMADKLHDHVIDNRKGLLEGIMLDMPPPYHMNAVYNRIPNNYNVPFLEFKEVWDALVSEGIAVHCSAAEFRHIDQQVKSTTANQPEPKKEFNVDPAETPDNASEEVDNTKETRVHEPYTRFSLQKETQLTESSVVIYQQYRSNTQAAVVRAAVLIDDGGKLGFRSLAMLNDDQTEWVKAEARKHVDPTNYKVLAVMPPLTEKCPIYQPQLRRVLEDEFLRYKEELENERRASKRKTLEKKVSTKLKSLDEASLEKLAALLEK